MPEAYESMSLDNDGVKPTVMLIHGSWHWSGCFVKLQNLLGTTGYPTVAPDLLSHGINDVPYDSFDTLEEYVEPAVALLEQIRTPVVLLGHSMGGVVASHLTERYADRVAGVAYLGAFLVAPGKSAADLIMGHADHPAVAELFELREVVGNGKGLELDLAKADLVREAFYADCDDASVRHATRGVSAISSTVPDNAVSNVTPERFGRIPRLYLELTEDRAIPLSTQQAMVESFPGTDVVSFDASHSPMYSQPAAIAEALDKWISERCLKSSAG